MNLKHEHMFMMSRVQSNIGLHMTEVLFYLRVCYLDCYLGVCHSGLTALVHTKICKKKQNKTQLVTDVQLDKPISRSSFGYLILCQPLRLRDVDYDERISNNVYVQSHGIYDGPIWTLALMDYENDRKYVRVTDGLVVLKWTLPLWYLIFTAKREVSRNASPLKYKCKGCNTHQDENTRKQYQ